MSTVVRSHRAVIKRSLLPAVAVLVSAIAGFLYRHTIVTTAKQVWALPNPSWSAVGIASAAVLVSYWWSALALRAAVGRPLPIGRTVAAQLAAATANRFTIGGIGGAAINGRYLTRRGFSVGEAGSAISLTGLAHVVVAAVGVAVIGPTLGGQPLSRMLPSVHLGMVPIAVIAIATAAMLAIVLHSRTRHASDWGRAVTRMLADLRYAFVDAARRPKRMAALLGCTAAVKVSGLIALLAATWAFDGDIADWRVATVYLVGVPAAEAVPTPGGIGVVDAVLLAGLMKASSGTAGSVVAAVLMFRLLTFWAPIVPGVLAGRALRERLAL